MSCNRDLRYRATQDFYRIEALHTARNDPADPIWLHVRVTPVDDLHNEIESALVRGADPHGASVSQHNKHPYRLFTGTWAFDIDPAIYEIGKQYTIHWRYAMQPDVLNVVRSNFVWQPPPDAPIDPNGCIVHGVVTRNRTPIAGARVVVEDYKNFVTLTNRLSHVEVSTDAFGYWWIEVPRHSIQRFIMGEIIETIRVPPRPCIALRDAPRWSANDVPKDSFGYPRPGSGAVRDSGGGANMAGISECQPAPPNLGVRVPLPPAQQPQPKPPCDPGCAEPFIFVQSTPATEWIIDHTLDGQPTVSIVDAAGDPVYGDIEYPSNARVVLKFLIPVAGTARLT